MTLLQVYNAVLVELNKVNAPNLLLEDFNYFARKAVNIYINKRYNIYDINQQTTDDLRVLKSTAILNAVKSNKYGDGFDFMDATYEVELPSDYLHILNCLCIYRVEHDPQGCYDKKYTRFAAKRLTADSWSEVVDNYWNRPSYKRPYYYIHNVNTSNVIPTNPYSVSGGTDVNTDISFTLILRQGKNKVEFIKGGKEGEYYYFIARLGEKVYSKEENPSSINSIVYITTGRVQSVLNTYEDFISALAPKVINLKRSIVEKESGVRYGNSSKVLMEIRYGSDDTDFKLEKVSVDYLKTPQYLLLTLTLIDKTTDTSLVLEFPDYVCQEIINELVTIIMENISDQRLQTQPLVTLSIANPVQQLAQPAARAVTQ